MQHIRFMDNNQTVCWAPERLDDYDSAVITDYDAGGKLCFECNGLLLAHNKKEFEKETHLSLVIPGTLRKESDMGCIRGALFGGAVTTLFWLVATLITWWLMR